MSFAAPRNPNYAATVTALKTFVEIPKADKVKSALVFGYSVIVSKDAPAGALGVFFPAECALSAEFLSENNLYRKHEYGNKDASGSTGYFEQHGRVKTMKFLGTKSEGFWIPIDSLYYLPGSIPVGALKEGDTFDMLGDHEICRKYVPKGQRVQGEKQPKGKIAKLEDSIVDGQFRFHFDTENLRRNAHKVKPDDIISVSDKWHGTSVVVANLLVKRPLSLLDRVAKWLGVSVQEEQYGAVHSSRRVVKGVAGIAKNSGMNFHKTDPHTAVAKELADKIPAGFTLYGEIVGYEEDGTPIMKTNGKPYTYGCAPGTHKFLLYRATMTSPKGLVVELGWSQLQEFAGKYGFETVPTFYHGKARDLFPALNVEHHWNDAFVAALEAKYVNDGDCPHNPKGTPAEGVVLRIDRLNEAENLKLKSFRFLKAESDALDKGEVDLETEESLQEETA